MFELNQTNLKQPWATLFFGHWGVSILGLHFTIRGEPNQIMSNLIYLFFVVEESPC